MKNNYPLLLKKRDLILQELWMRGIVNMVKEYPDCLLPEIFNKDDQAEKVFLGSVK